MFLACCDITELALGARTQSNAGLHAALASLRVMGAEGPLPEVTRAAPAGWSGAADIEFTHTARMLQGLVLALDVNDEREAVPTRYDWANLLTLLDSMHRHRGSEGAGAPVGAILRPIRDRITHDTIARATGLSGV
jgi:hypothetical protein